MKKTNTKFATKFISMVLATTIIFSMAGCSKTSAKPATKAISVTSLEQLQEMKFDTENHAYIYDSTSEEKTKTSNKLQQQADGVYIRINGDYFLQAELDSAIKTGQNIGLIVTPSNYTYESLYKTIDMIKDIITTYDIDLGVYYDIDKYMSDDTIRANVLLGEMFCLKLTANGVYCGFYGSDTNMEKFTKVFPKYIELHSIDLFDKLIRVNEQENIINYQGIYHSAEYEEGLVFSRFDIAEVIDKNNLNSSQNFISDYTYNVVSGDSISSIAEKYNIKVEDLVAYNNIENPNNIQVGQIIKIPNHFTDINSLISSMEDGEISQSRSHLMKGIDVSSWQKTVDWSKVSQNADFAIVRIFEGSFGEDSHAKVNLKGCEENNLPVGCYWFSYAMTPEEAEIEAQKVVELLDGYKKEFKVNLEYPIFMDLESEKQLALGEEKIRDIIASAAKVIENHGYSFGVYINRGNYNMVKDCGYPLWMTSSQTYNNKTEFYDFKKDSFTIHYETDKEKVMWQYSQKGKIDGIEGYVDINYATSTLTQKVTNTPGYKLQ